MLANFDAPNSVFHNIGSYSKSKVPFSKHREAKLTNTKSVTQGEVAKVTDDNFVQDLDCNDYWIDPLMGVRRSSAQVKVCSNAIVAKLAAPSDPGSGLNESETNFEATDHIGKIVENVHGYNKYDEQLVPKHLKPHKLSSQRTSLHLQHLLIENNQLLENIMLMERQLESRKKEISGLKAKLEQMAKSSQIETLGSVNSILNSQDS